MRYTPLFQLIRTSEAVDRSRWLSVAALSMLILVLNGIVLTRMLLPGGSANLAASLGDILWQLGRNDVQLWLSVNVALGVCYFLVRWRYHAPFHGLRQLMQQTSDFLDKPLVISRANAAAVVKEMATLSQLVKEQSLKRMELDRELNLVRSMLDQYDVERQTILRSTNREMSSQYEAVLGYAHYLDEHIQRRTADTQLRYDFDDVSESGFNLKLIAEALELLRQPTLPATSHVSVPLILQQTMLALAPSLDRRVMKLTTAEVDETATVLTNAPTLSHAIWMVLLGMIRYAAEESTLRMRCLYNRDRTEVLLSVVVSELAPGTMSPEERSAHLIRQTEPGSPHMFAETIRIQGNIQLADMLLKRLGSRIDVVPLSAYACEVCIRIPAA